MNNKELKTEIERIKDDIILSGNLNEEDNNKWDKLYFELIGRQNAQKEILEFIDKSKNYPFIVVDLIKFIEGELKE